jgi:hypothetical protein
MTEARKRIEAFIVKLKRDVARNDEIAGKLITNALECEQLAHKLEKILPDCTDEMCEAMVRDWEPEKRDTLREG